MTTYLGMPGLRVDRSGVDAEAGRTLQDRLARTVNGEVNFDATTRAVYASDSSNYRQVPIGVVFPRDTGDVEATLAAAAEVGAPVLGRGGGTGLAGQTCNVAVVMDFSRHMNKVLELDPEARIARVQPGIVLDDLRARTNEFDLTFGPDPATHAYCTIGGMIGNNSCGTHSVYAGKTVDNVESMKILTYDGTALDVGKISEQKLIALARQSGRVGEIYGQISGLRDDYAALIAEKYPKIPRRVSGYNLDSLLEPDGPHIARSLVGSESTLAIVTEATLKLVTWPPYRRLVVLGYKDIFTAADYAAEFRALGPIGLEGVDDVLAGQMRKRNMHTASLDALPEGRGWVLAEFGGFTPEEVDAKVATFVASVAGNPCHRLCVSAADQKAMWAVRESGLGATARPPGEKPNIEGWEDAAVPPERLGEYMRAVSALWKDFGYTGAWYGHLGDGCMHTRSNFDFGSVDGIKKYREYVDRASDICVELGGSLSGEHGDGQARAELYPKMFGPEIVTAFEKFKAIWDPEERMNPGKLVKPFPLDSNLKHGPDLKHNPISRTTFNFGHEGHSLQDAADRCVGVGRCRRTDTGVMCPSYRATGDEVHSTRGRAKLLQEMFRGEVTPATWRNKDVKGALDLCLSCKGCKIDCPTAVDMATFKAEFLSHYFKRRLRPRAAYTLGLIRYSSRLASKMPRLANLVLASPLGKLIRRAGGVTTSRPAPKFAKQTLRKWLAGQTLDTTGPEVVLWLDTFTNYLGPEAGQAAVAVLQDKGVRVVVPEQDVCCGRPLYDYGMLDTAKKHLRKTIAVLSPWIESSTPIIVLEPSCLATFRDEMLGLFPDDPKAQRLAGLVMSLPEYLALASTVEDSATPTEVQAATSQRPKALLQVHCHQHANGGSKSDVEVLTSIGYDVEVLDAGCCGLAGSFGFDAHHADLSKKIAGERLLPMLAAQPDAVVVADGFSCATQIRQLAGREVKSIAELVAEGTAS